MKLLVSHSSTATNYAFILYSPNATSNRITTRAVIKSRSAECTALHKWLWRMKNQKYRQTFINTMCSFITPPLPPSIYHKIRSNQITTSNNNNNTNLPWSEINDEWLKRSTYIGLCVVCSFFCLKKASHLYSI